MLVINSELFNFHCIVCKNIFIILIVMNLHAQNDNDKDFFNYIMKYFHTI